MNTKALKWKVFRYLNDNPRVKVKRCVRIFGGEGDAVIRSYYMMWSQFMKPLRWLYDFMNKKWVLDKHITLADKRELRIIEAMIEGESERED